MCANGPPIPDGRPDYGFRVRISGEATAIVLASTDLKGKIDWIDVFDTLMEGTVFPAPIGRSPLTPKFTWVVAVVDAQGALLNPQGPLARGTFGDEPITLYVCDPGNDFATHRIYSVFVLRPDGTADRSTTQLL
jgi:hypothetical protein